jgi:3-hydroxyisobutyrate dehydrogenase-like beta-hydroxyacid dehydrogenase
VQIRNIGIVSPGDMGQAVAMRLKESGFVLYGALAGRSERTRSLAREAGITDCGSMMELVAQCDLLLSVLDPAVALDNARTVAAAMKHTGRKPVFVDCNAVAPATMEQIAAIVREAGGDCVDVGIIGSPPRGNTQTRIYASGPHASVLQQIKHPNLVVRVISESIGDASAVKMCYGAITKGAVALGLELLITARRMGVYETVESEFRESIPGVYDWMLGRVPSTPPKAYRWVPEMNEIARTFGDAGLTPKMFQGAAEMFEFVAATPLGKESPEEARARARSGGEVVRQLAD